MTFTIETPSSNQPSHIVYHVRDSESGKAFFTPLGAAWPHKDGKGFNIQVNTIPLDGKLTLRIKEAKD